MGEGFHTYWAQESLKFKHYHNRKYFISSLFQEVYLFDTVTWYESGIKDTTLNSLKFGHRSFPCGFRAVMMHSHWHQRQETLQAAQTKYRLSHDSCRPVHVVTSFTMQHGNYV